MNNWKNKSQRLSNYIKNEIHPFAAFKKHTLSSNLDTILGWNDTENYSKNMKIQVDIGTPVYDQRDLKP